MLIIAIAWLYVVILMAFAETSIVAGLVTFFLYGAGPLAIILWLFGTPERRRRQRRREATAAAAADEVVNDTVTEIRRDARVDTGHEATEPRDSEIRQRPGPVQPDVARSGPPSDRTVHRAGNSSSGPDR